MTDFEVTFPGAEDLSAIMLADPLDPSDMKTDVSVRYVL